MRILLIPPNDLFRHPIPNRIYHIAKRFVKKHDIYLLSYTKHPLCEGVKRKIKVIEIPINNALAVKNLGFYFILNTPQIYTTIKRMIKSRNIDVVIHANILPSLIASKLAKRFGIPNIYDFVDYYPESASAYYTQGKWFVELGVKILVAQALKNSDIVVTPSYSLKKVIEEFVYGRSIYVVPNGVDVELFKPQDQALARKAIGLDSDYYLALLQGTLDDRVDIATVLKVMSKLRRAVDIRLLVVGFSSAKHYYRALLDCAKHYGIDKYVYMYSRQPDERMPLFINSCDFVISPVKKMIKNFATPLKIAEALACGVPVVTAHIPEYGFWYRQGIYTYTTYAELENVIKQLLAEIDEIKAALCDYVSSFRETFSWDRLAEEYEKLLGLVA
jgi:glycosyltransferase involved in cell wall biosynthesis